MRKQFLSSYFDGVAVKRLSAVEANPARSNQHEFNGVVSLKNMFGLKKQEIDTLFMYLTEDETQYISERGKITWYDARENHKTRTEYRLYYPTNETSKSFREGDLLLIGKLHNGESIVLGVEKDSTIENQVLWLFGFDDISSGFKGKKINEGDDTKLSFASKFILDEIGIEIEEEIESSSEGDILALMLERFNNSFPKTKDFSDFARETLQDVDYIKQPDESVLKWIEQEEKLFKILEKHFVSQRLKDGFGENGEDVDEFIKFSLSVQNRRKSRVGHSLENHLEYIFLNNTIKYSRGKYTENRSKPDFIFPEISYYLDKDFPVELLTMLGSKSTCKDRWRQVLSEAKRIEDKHLFTLEPAISINQTNEMRDRRLQLVIPAELHQTYTEEQQEWLMTVSDFLDLVKDRESRIASL